MRRVAIVQARMTSERLPGKILLDVAGTPMLARQLRRLRRSVQLDAIVIATTTNATDDPVVTLASQESVEVFRGDEHDVLGRYLGAARAHDAGLIVRVTGDCPLIDPTVVDSVVEMATSSSDRCDYASNTIRRSFPRGLDVEALHRDVLERIGRLATSTPAREHVTYFLHRERPELFDVRQVVRSTDASDLRWTVDTADDLDLIRRMFEELDADTATTDELVERVRARPELSALNQHIEQKKT
ncbi:MAG: NTP transferase domain-containing protein [Kofleriaceae bacterium]